MVREKDFLVRKGIVAGIQNVWTRSILWMIFQKGKSQFKTKRILSIRILINRNSHFRLQRVTLWSKALSDKLWWKLDCRLECILALLLIPTSREEKMRKLYQAKELTEAQGTKVRKRRTQRSLKSRACPSLAPTVL